MKQKKWRFFTWTRDNHKAFADAVAEELDTKASKETVDELVAGTVSNSGDTMTGGLTLRFPTAPISPIFPIIFKGKFSDGPYSTEYTWGLGLSTVSTVFYIRYDNQDILAITPVTGIIPQRKGLALGANYGMWENTFTKKLNNGADIEIPNKAGTMALVSDIEEILRKHKLIPDEPETQTEQPQ